MKVILAGYFQGNGGAERQICMLAGALSERGYETHLAVIADNDIRFELPKDVRITDLSDPKGGRAVLIIRRFFRLREMFRKIKPDISVHFWLQSAMFATLFPRRFRGSVIYSERGDPGDSEYTGIKRIFQKHTVKHVDGLVFQSAGARDYFGAVAEGRSEVIHNAVSVPESVYTVPCGTREKRIVNVGRLHPQKNQRLLIRAFSLIAGDFPDFRLEIYGDGPEKDGLLELIRKLGIEGRAFVLPGRSDIFDIIYASSLFVLSSDYEGMPNVLMEALALGVPCVSTDCRPGGARELINPGTNGIIVPAGDEKQLAAAMAKLLSDTALADAFSKNGISIRASNSRKSVYDRWDKFINDLIGKKADEKRTDNRA